MFKKFDTIGNDVLDLDEALIGVRRVLGLRPEFINDQVIKCAFETAFE